MVSTALSLPSKMKIMNAKRPISPENAFARAAALCSKCEQAESDIRKKLKDWGIASHDAEYIIERLTDEKYLDEQRFATAFTRDKFRFDKWGRTKITYSLKLKQISPQAIEQALDEIDEDDYLITLQHILSTKAKTLKGKEPLQMKASLLRFAASRGFEPSLIYPLLPEYADCDEDF